MKISALRTQISEAIAQADESWDNLITTFKGTLIIDEILDSIDNCLRSNLTTLTGLTRRVASIDAEE